MPADRESWLPDGRGIPDEARAQIAQVGQQIHLRLTAPNLYPRTACGGGLGEWWTGISTEVTCPACLPRVRTKETP